MNEMEEMRTFADQLWKYFGPKLEDRMSRQVGFFRAEVVSNPGNGKLVVKRPLENANLTLPCTNAMTGAAEGDQVIVLTMGSMSNAVAIAGGRMNVPAVDLLYSAVTYGPEDVVTFGSPGAGLPLKSCTAEINAVQAGSGEPSPTNIRPISGWTGCTLSVSGADTTNPTVYSVSWQTEAGTVYGGTVDLVSGVLTVKRFFVALDGTEPWNNRNPGQSNNRYDIVIADMDWPKPAAVDGEICSHYKETVVSGTAQAYGLFRVTSNYLIVYDRGNTGFSDLASFKAYLAAQYAAGTPVQVVYDILNPVTYQLTPQEITALAGVNRVWADCGDVTVEFGAFLSGILDRLT